METRIKIRKELESKGIPVAVIQDLLDTCCINKQSTGNILIQTEIVKGKPRYNFYEWDEEEDGLFEGITLYKENNLHIKLYKDPQEIKELYPWHVLEITTGFQDTESIDYSQYEDEDQNTIGIIIYSDDQAMLRDAQRTLNDLDLESGGDDSYYDYNPAAVESLIYAASKFPLPIGMDILNGILARINDFLNLKEEQDEDMVDQYTSIKNFIQAYKAKQIGIYELVKNTTPF